MLSTTPFIPARGSISSISMDDLRLTPTPRELIISPNEASSSTANSDSSSPPSSSMIRRSSSAPKPRRGSSLPISLASSNTNPTIEHELNGNDNSGDNKLSMLQFISSTIEPSWDEIESSPFEFVPSIFPISSAQGMNLDMDIITFLRQAPTPGIQMSRSDSLSSVSSSILPPNNDNLNAQSNLVTPQVSLQAFLEEQANLDQLIDFTFTSHQSQSRFPSNEYENVNGGGDDTLSMKEFFDSEPPKFYPTATSTFTSPTTISRSSTISDSISSGQKGILSNVGLGIEVRDRQNGVGKVMKRAREALRMGRN
ncbi:uncharacterized protein IL334_002027 [Kwoniella shivajii]|uniref:Uncharacterized protein n=1 Tax=Kwoniella shivajii TaxID=564305 RepID=A0ABZ1CTX5_9TREE|nr:hypothetical protein IL334_002027 [Kwoniella shivajii]